MIRSDFLLQGLDKSSCKGVEVGPWYNPVAPKREGWQSTVIDFKDGSSLINAALGHTDEAIRNLAHQVEDVDIVWKGNASIFYYLIMASMNSIFLLVVTA